MIKNIKPQEMIKTEQFIREPVDSLNKEIRENSSKRIILNGGRGSGKSVILNNAQDKGLGTENQTILIQFDSAVTFATNPNELFDATFFDHYYELVFSLKLLSYIKDNYILTYEANFKDIDALLQSVSKNTNDYIRNRYYEKSELQRYLRPGETFLEIWCKFRECMGIDNLTLAIDRFDSINGSSPYTQHIISKYFAFFNKVIITVDDLSLNDKSKKVELENKGYSFITAMYGKNVDVIKQIIRKRIELYNKTANPIRPFDESFLTDKIYSNLTDKANGNISLILNTCLEIADSFNYSGCIENLESDFENEFDYQLSKVKKLIKTNGTPPKLHL